MTLPFHLAIHQLTIEKTQQCLTCSSIISFLFVPSSNSIHLVEKWLAIWTSGIVHTCILGRVPACHYIHEKSAASAASRKKTSSFQLYTVRPRPSVAALCSKCRTCIVKFSLVLASGCVAPDSPDGALPPKINGCFRSLKRGTSHCVS